MQHAALPIFLPHFAAKGVVEDFGPAEMVQHIGQQNGYLHDVFGPPHPTVNRLFQYLKVKPPPLSESGPGRLGDWLTAEPYQWHWGGASFRHFKLPFYVIAGSIGAFATRNP